MAAGVVPPKRHLLLRIDRKPAGFGWFAPRAGGLLYLVLAGAAASPLRCLESASSLAKAPS